MPDYSDDYIVDEGGDGETPPPFEPDEDTSSEIGDPVEFISPDIPPKVYPSPENAEFFRWATERLVGLSSATSRMGDFIGMAITAHGDVAGQVSDAAESTQGNSEALDIQGSILLSNAEPARPTTPVLSSGLSIVVAEWDGLLYQLGTDGLESPRIPEAGFREVFAEIAYVTPTAPPTDPDEFPDGVDDVEGPDDDTGLVLDGGVAGEDDGAVVGEDDGDEVYIQAPDDGDAAPEGEDNQWVDPTAWFRAGSPLTEAGSIHIQAPVGATVWVRLVALDFQGRVSEGSDPVSIVVKGVELPDLEADIANEIQSAIDAAEAAQTTADGKNKIIVSVTEPAGTDYAQGDQWWIRNATDSGQLDGVRVWNGSAWVNYQVVANSIIVPGTVNDTVIADGAIKTTKLDAGAVTAAKIAAGTITANEIQAGAITGTLLSFDAIDGKTITGAVMRTASSGQRLQFDTVGLRAYNASNTLTASLTAASGGLTLSGVLRSGSGNQRAELFSTGLRFYNTDNVIAGAIDGTTEFTRATMNFRPDGTTARLRIQNVGAIFDTGLTVNGDTVITGNLNVNARLTADNFPGAIVSGAVTITPSAANVPTSLNISFPAGMFSTAPQVQVTPNTTGPGTAVRGVSYSNVTTSGCTLWLTRTDTTPTGIAWTAIGN